MKTVGDLIKEVRSVRKVTKEELGNMTHIKTSFIADIEKGNWEELPPFSITLGFIKSISHFLDIDENHAVALFRREYPEKLKKFLDRAQDSPSTTLRASKFERKFTWGPRITFLAGILIIIFIVIGYLGFQYRKFNAPPLLIVDEPKENQQITGSDLIVKGRTDPDSTIIVNNQALIVDSDGNFSASISVSGENNKIVITAKSRSGRETKISRTITFTK